MAPTSHTYFDYYQGPAQTEPKALGGDVRLEKVYRYEPIPAALNADQAKHVLGGQAQLWGEYISNQKHRFYMAYPRAAAMAKFSGRLRSRNYQFLIRLSSTGPPGLGREHGLWTTRPPGHAQTESRPPGTAQRPSARIVLFGISPAGSGCLRDRAAVA
jgi:hypothetical protein